MVPAMGRNNRWWNEKIYGSFVGGLHPTEKKTLGEESDLYIWLTLIEGGVGAMFWQYRPEYMTYEAPGLNIAALDGEPTERLHAATATIAQIDRIADHLPLAIPCADVAIAYSGPSDDAFDFNDQGVQFIQHHRARYRALWAQSVAMDLVTPAMNWSEYSLVYLPHFSILDEMAIVRLRSLLRATAPTSSPMATLAPLLARATGASNRPRASAISSIAGSPILMSSLISMSGLARTSCRWSVAPLPCRRG